MRTLPKKFVLDPLATQPDAVSDSNERRTAASPARIIAVASWQSARTLVRLPFTFREAALFVAVMTVVFVVCGGMGVFRQAPDPFPSGRPGSP